MLHKICWRLVLSKNTIKWPITQLNQSSQLHLRTITTNKSLLTSKANNVTSVKIYHGVLSTQIKAVKVQVYIVIFANYIVPLIMLTRKSLKTNFGT